MLKICKFGKQKGHLQKKQKKNKKKIEKDDHLLSVKKDHLVKSSPISRT